MIKTFAISLLLTIVTMADSPLHQTHQTGQKYSYDENGTIVTDNSIEDDGFHRKGLRRNYTHTAGVVTDHSTGLEWQDNYSDNEEDKTKEASWIDAIEYCENLSLNGGEWRLPSRIELASINDYSRYNPSIDESVFQQAEIGSYWSNTSYAKDDSDAWIIDLRYSLQQNGSKSGSYYVRCVRKGNSDETPMLSRSGDIVTDGRTGLQWQDDEVHKHKWTEGIDSCKELTLGGHNDWRMPNINELASIADYASNFSSLPEKVFLNI